MSKAKNTTARRNGFIEHPGAIARRLIEHHGVSQVAAAEALGISRQQLIRVITCEAAISTEMAIRLSLTLPGAVSPREWLRMQADYDLDQADEAAIKKQVTKLR